MPDADSFQIDGVAYTADDLTFREQRELRTIVRDLVDDPEVNIEDMAMMDFLPALVYVIVKRDNAEFTLDEALDMKISDLLPAENGNGKKPARRPTQSAAGSSGRQK